LLGLVALAFLFFRQSLTTSPPPTRAVAAAPPGATTRAPLAEAGETAEPGPATAPATAEAGATLPAPEPTGRPTAESGATSQPEDDPTIAAGEEEVAGPELPPREGALIGVVMESQVGVLLDELPLAARDRAVSELLAQPEAFWRQRAARQVDLTQYRLTFRNFFYADKGQLPLPPAELWRFDFDPAGATRQSIQGHDLVVISYTLSSTLLTGAESPAEAEPALAAVGGRWEEPFTLPLDPELLFQRTGNACINEGGFPPNSYDAENYWNFFDQTCTADSAGPLGCHRTTVPAESCFQALSRYTGLIQTYLRFERLEWDDELADEVRVGEVTVADAADLQVLSEDMADHRIIYRYFPGDSCALVENCINATGWRRLLQFDATVHNLGGVALHIGPVQSENATTNLFQYNACHDHFHFSYYGSFLFGEGGLATGSKQAFCVESTGRFSNNEWSPLTHPYSCRFQGVQAGWVDEYISGLDCQWIDITNVFAAAEAEEDDSAAAPLAATSGITLPLTFLANGDGFLCEGTPVLDEDGNQLWEPTDLRTATGQVVQRPVCDYAPGWDSNNVGGQDVFLRPSGGYVTEPCQRNHLGPRRNCDFAAVETRQKEGFACEPLATVRLSCAIPATDPPLVARFCDFSQALGVGVSCTFNDALVNVTVEPGETQEVSFTCPGPRDEQEMGGQYSLYVAPLLPGEAAGELACEVIEEDE
jgi:hypothetical protein